MCGRYVMARAIGDLVADAEAEADAALELRRSWNIAPTTDVPIVLERLVKSSPVRQIHVASWGLVPGWAKDPKVGVRAFNARSETVAEKPTFRSAVKSRRCAVPAEGYYEWKAPAGGSRAKRPHYVRPRDGSLIYFAGLYEWWKDPAKAEDDPGRWLLSTSILTTAAPPADAEEPVLRGLAELHDRLPIPLRRDVLGDWLDPGNRDAPALVDAVRGGAYGVASGWRLDEVGPAVGNVRNDGPELLEPLEPTT
ncbi:SOS response-associated peptidase [Zafaria sp. Z1313]|uniref:SOS response-associated peptidase n=1 Tax=unclassified Zafaria TaxID=2828765 RepID=UPI002E769383|nr:SOS response-associated peptidase [Zafaria sp. J156]MEE1621088.1 SOS response-associated peptidase [Zafaria sp. J156]